MADVESEDRPRPPAGAKDHVGAWFAVGFLALLLGSEAALTLPDENASPADTAAFYVDHGTAVVVLQLVGIGAAALLAGYAWRLRRVDRVVSATAATLAVLACAPGLLTIATALVADPAHPGSAGTLNRWEPRADDLLFLGILAFVVIVATRLGRDHAWLAVLAGAAAAACVGRLALEALQRPRGALDSIAPISFLLVVGCMAVMSYRGSLRPTRQRLG